VLLDIIVGGYDHTLIDLPRRIDPIAIRVLERAQHIVLVVQQSVTVLRDATRLMSCLRRDLGIVADRVTVVVNRYQKDGAVSLEDVRNTLACGEITVIPNDFRSVSECIATGQPLLAHARSASITKAVTALATKLGGGAAATAPGLVARALSNLIRPRSP
jgi:pilus assembly protein CpaE